LGSHPAKSCTDLVKNSSVVILAVKPQQMPEVLREISPDVSRRHLVISIAAGISTSAIERVLGAGIRVVRVMPNTPAQIREGVSVLCRGRFASASDLKKAQVIFKALGVVLELPESTFHAVTAVSGSGPAYVFYLMEAMLEAGRNLKIPQPALEKLVRQTVAGSAQLALQSSLLPEILRQRVTSKGGTTEAAIRAFDAKQVRAALVAGVQAAAKRSKALRGMVRGMVRLPFAAAKELGA
ncbi:MAG: pyrroline-5-carboxylate reductase, partial [Candidatus Omnitrophica bacterium]|nr:pyrroline-5-carboxylate reductase [Candidatus Omnitrophota bacterium]